jgi:hypothetical protein
VEKYLTEPHHHYKYMWHISDIAHILYTQAVAFVLKEQTKCLSQQHIITSNTSHIVHIPQKSVFASKPKIEKENDFFTATHHTVHIAHIPYIAHIPHIAHILHIARILHRCQQRCAFLLVMEAFVHGIYYLSSVTGLCSRHNSMIA